MKNYFLANKIMMSVKSAFAVALTFGKKQVVIKKENWEIWI